MIVMAINGQQREASRTVSVPGPRWGNGRSRSSGTGTGERGGDMERGILKEGRAGDLGGLGYGERDMEGGEGRVTWAGGGWREYMEGGE